MGKNDNQKEPAQKKSENELIQEIEQKKKEEENPDEFKQISHFSNECSVHLLHFGIELSKNHPILKDEKLPNEIKDKFKGASIEVDKSNVSKPIK